MPSAGAYHFPLAPPGRVARRRRGKGPVVLIHPQVLVVRFLVSWCYFLSSQRPVLCPAGICMHSVQGGAGHDEGSPGVF